MAGKAPVMRGRRCLGAWRRPEIVASHMDGPILLLSPPEGSFSPPQDPPGEFGEDK